MAANTSTSSADPSALRICVVGTHQGAGTPGRSRQGRENILGVGTSRARGGAAFGSSVAAPTAGVALTGALTWWCTSSQSEHSAAQAPSRRSASARATASKLLSTTDVRFRNSRPFRTCSPVAARYNRYSSSQFGVQVTGQRCWPCAVVASPPTNNRSNDGNVNITSLAFTGPPVPVTARVHKTPKYQIKRCYSLGGAVSPHSWTNAGAPRLCSLQTSGALAPRSSG
eukprot:1178273-Prorocentrum_minimum.AAC.1